MEITLFAGRRKVLKGEVNLVASKSIASRHLLIQAISGEISELSNFSDAEDTQHLYSVLQYFLSNPYIKKEYNAGAGGTTFRFLTAYFASRPCSLVLNCTRRMSERPVGELVNALQKLGAKIRYLKKNGFPPLAISGKKLKGGCIAIDSGISSQFISAIMMIAPTFSDGLELQFSSNLVSRPYIKMTAEIMQEYGIHVELNDYGCCIFPGQYSIDSRNEKLKVEGDWSSASYFYALASCSSAADFTLTNLNEKSNQPDAYCTQIFRLLGVDSEFKNQKIRISKKKAPLPEEIEVDCTDCPDLAQTLAVVCSAKKIPLKLKGLSTLRSKETDRIAALQSELFKFGVFSEAGNDYLFLNPENFNISTQKISIDTYDDHRMAMCFAPLALLQKQLKIKNPEVVKKSYPDFWNALKKIGIQSKLS